MSNQPVIYIVKPEQIGKEDITTFLRNAIHKQFDGKEYYISKELDETKTTYYSPNVPRKLRGFLINEANKIGHAIYFDITDVPNITWVGHV